MLLLAFVILLLCFADENFFYPHKGKGERKSFVCSEIHNLQGGAKKFCLLTYKVYSNKDRAWRHMRELW